ncbi:MAG TPA: TIM barrel protein [Candidatus Pacearchaeota archaeon]|nr:TIM barrel protein [Candidatus Pacearchaeota archaeon]
MGIIKIGPSGMGGVKEAEEILEEFNRVKFGNCEVAFTHSVYMNKEQAEKIGKLAKKNKIELSIHAPYFVNLNSEEKAKIHASMQRILKCCEIGHYLEAKNIVFHPGYYGKSKDKEETFQNIKKRILEMMEIIKEKKWEVELCPETMGKINVFGSIEEISRLSKETGCSFCIDFAHILARDKKVDYEKIKKLFSQKNWHCHFSGIEYTEKGERNHINLKKEQWKELFDNIPKDKNITIVCESPNRVEDCIEGLEVLKGR